MDQWNVLSSQAEIDAFLSETGWCHDSCIVELRYKSGAFVNTAGAMGDGAPEAHEARLLLHSQCVGQAIELCFIGVRRFCINGWTDNYFCDISGCTLCFRTDLIPDSSEPLIVWADVEDFSPLQDTAAPLDLSIPGCSYLIASALKWRFRPPDAET